jgi:acetyl-CoA acetyltransferase
MPNTLNRVAIVGVGYSQTGRRLDLTDDEMVRQSVTAAMADAGMGPADIDGVSTMGGRAMEIGHLLGLDPLSHFFSSDGGPAFVEPAMNAYMAVASGMAHTVVAIRLIRQMPGQTERLRGDVPVVSTVAGTEQFTAPFGGAAAAASIAGLEMTAHMAKFGTTEEQFAINASTQRHHATLNEDALMRDPLTVEDYLAARYVSKPVRLFDCDYPVDSSSAVIYTTGDRAGNWAKKPVMVEAGALSAIRDMNFWQLDDFATTSPKHCADLLWSRTDLKPADVDCAQLYDGFTIITMQWLEALGFCGMGESGPFVQEGNTRLGGRLPLNTDGGACNVGRRHGANFCIESVRQIRGECGERQVPGAEVAVWTNAVGPFAGAMLLTG